MNSTKGSGVDRLEDYRIVFKGYQKNCVPEQAVAAITDIFGLEREKAAKLLRFNKRTVLKRGLDQVHAQKCAKAMERAGLQVEIEARPLDYRARNKPRPTSDAMAVSSPGPWGMGGADTIPATAEVESEATHHERPGRLGFMAGWRWILRGWSLFRASPLAWMLAMLVWFFLVTGLHSAFTALTSLSALLLPVAGSVLINLLTPLVTGGLMVGCRVQEQGEGFSVKYLFTGFTHHAGSLLMIGAIYFAALSLVAVGMAAALLFIIGGGPPPARPEDLLDYADLYPLLLVVFVACLCIVAILMAALFAPALVALDGIGALQAMKLSFQGSLANLMPLSLHGLIALILFFLGVLPLGLGLLIVLPLLIASVYAAYDEIFHTGG